MIGYSPQAEMCVMSTCLGQVAERPAENLEIMEK
jgi:hypothetical protein